MARVEHLLTHDSPRYVQNGENVTQALGSGNSEVATAVENSDWQRSGGFVLRVIGKMSGVTCFWEGRSGIVVTRPRLVHREDDFELLSPYF
jgi:hypothetical protein